MSVAVGASIIPVPASVAAGAAVDCRAYEAKTLTIEGTFSATVQYQISCDRSDSPAATSWVNFGSALTAPGNLFLQQPVAYVRANVTAYVSGTPIGRVAGMTKVN